MTKLLSVLFLLAGMSMVAVDTEAASRVGGGRSVGAQRNTASQPAQKTAPAQQQQSTQTAPAPAAQPQSGMSKWLGPLAGLALGAGLASLFMNNGIAGALGGIMMVLLLAGIAFFAIRWFMNRGKPRQETQLQYAGASSTGSTAQVPASSTAPAQFTGNAAPGSLAAQLGGGAAAGAMTPMPSSQWPAGFDAPEFERQAKSNFVRLQAANDAGDASTLRDYVTPELFRELETEMKAAWGKPQKNEVVELNAEVIDVVTEGSLYIVSVRFTGKISENGAPAEAFDEIWHLEKPTTGRSGWLVSGIQQAN